MYAYYFFSFMGTVLLGIHLSLVYLNLKLIFRKKILSLCCDRGTPFRQPPPASAGTTPGVAGPGGQKSGQQTDGGPIRAPAPMWRCSKIMHLQRELHPTILNSLEGIVDQVCTKY